MAYIGSSPIEKGTGLFSQDTFTGDGSTTTFDLTNAAPDGGGNELQVFVDNVRQQEGSSNAYTLGQDGSGDLKRITFTAAPAASAAIYVLNPGTKNVQQISTVSDNAVTTAKVQDSAITAAKISEIPNDSVSAAKVADNAVSEEHLDVTAVTGHTLLDEQANDADVLLVFDTSASALKKVTKANIAPASPVISSVSPTNANESQANLTLVITGTGFTTGTNARLITTSGKVVPFDTVTRNSATQVTAIIATSSLAASDDPYDVQVVNGEGLATTKENQINFNASPTFVTAAGSLGSSRFTMSAVKVNAIDPESAANVTFELQSGSLPAGVTLVNTAAEGGTAIFTGTLTAQASDTVSNFVLRAVDAASNTTSRAFSFTALGPSSTSFTSSGTFAVPTGQTSVDVLVVAGGGGVGSNPGPGGLGGAGAGGLIFQPGYPVTPGGTLTATVGGGGGAGSTGQDSVFGAPGDPGKHPSGDVLTAKGGGYGGQSPSTQPGGPGGSGGGGRGGYNGQSGYGPGPATQPTQPGDSGAYGFGNAGGSGGGGPTPNGRGEGGGGGGAGAAGQTGTPGGANGGIGKAYTIADGTTSVYYAGGGGAGGSITYTSASGCGGQGGGGQGSPYSPSGVNPAHDGTANKGGGGGGSGGPGPTGGTVGGSGIIIVRG